MKFNWDKITLVVGIGMNILPFLHIFQIVKDSSSKGQSLIAIFGYIFCFCVWFIYGYIKKDSVIKWTNSTAIIVNILLIFLNLPL